MPNLRSLPVAIHHFSTLCVKAGECHTVCRGVPCTHQPECMYLTSYTPDMMSLTHIFAS